MNQLEEKFHVMHSIANTSILRWPFPHFYIENIFSDQTYKEIIENLPDEELLSPIKEKRPIKGDYKDRFVLIDEDMGNLKLNKITKNFWLEFKDIFSNEEIMNLILSFFSPILTKIHGTLTNLQFRQSFYLAKDIKNYHLGPHTDSKSKVITLIFYLAKEESELCEGTSIYVPKDYNFQCAGGPHYDFDQFNKVKTFSYKKNTLFGFIKTNNSFHGVEKKVTDSPRWLLLFDIHKKI